MARSVRWPRNRRLNGRPGRAPAPVRSKTRSAWSRNRAVETLMTPQKIAAADVASFDELKSLAAAKGVCITLIEPIPNPLEIRTRLKNAIRGVEKKLADHAAAAEAIPALVEPIHAIASDAETEGKWANSLVVFRSAEIFRRYWLHELLQEALTVANRFQIRRVLGL